MVESFFIKIDSDTVTFMRILRIFYEKLFCEKLLLRKTFHRHDIAIDNLNASQNFAVLWIALVKNRWKLYSSVKLFRTSHIAAHFNNLGWRNYTCLYSQFKVAKYLCFIIRECKRKFCPQNSFFINLEEWNVNAFKRRLFIKPAIQERGTECGNAGDVH